MTNAGFTHDVFLSHSSRDKDDVRALAERLRNDGVRVWFDEWEIQLGDSIPMKMEEGLERSRLLLFAMSANAFASEWPWLESQTLRFRDPLNGERRFFPLRLDESEPHGSLAQFQYVDWRPSRRDESYQKLLAACRQLPPIASAEEEEAESREIVLSSHINYVSSVAFHPDGRRALSGSADNTLRLWEVETGRCLRVLRGHTNEVLSVAWSGDGRLALSASSDNTLRLWEVETGRCLRVFEGHTNDVVSVAWSNDGRRALSGSRDNTLGLWDVETGSCLRVFRGHTDYVLSVAWSGDGRRALSGSADNTIWLWDVEAGRCLRVFKGHTSYVRSVAWSDDGRHALSGSGDNSLRLWDVETGRVLRVFKGHTQSVFNVAWSGHSRALSGSGDNTLRLWDVGTGSCLRVVEAPTDSLLSVAWSGHGRRALSGSSDHTLRLWNVETGRCLRVFEGHTDSLLIVAWSANGGRALSGSRDNTLRLWGVEAGRCLRVFEGHTTKVVSIAWSGDGRRALSGSSDRTLRLWDVETGRCLRVFEGHTNEVLSVAWSGDGRRTLSGSADNTLRLWNVETGRCLRVLEGHTNSVLIVAWNANGGRALSGSRDNTLRLWDVDAGRCLRVFEGHTNEVLSVAWSGDGRRALSGSSGRTLRLWDVETGRCLRVFEGHTNEVLSVAWSGDGRCAISGSSDRTLRLWNVETGRCLRVLEGHTSSVLSVAWSANGRSLLSADGRGIMRVWTLPEPAAVSPLADVSLSDERVAEQVQYTNAKVLLVGESGAGKTALSMRLARNDWQPSDSTVGAWATQWKLPAPGIDGVEREVWLWDFGGQADQRLIQQLYMNDTAVAILVFDGQREAVLEGLRQWNRDLERASRRPFTKLLVAGRVDGGGLRVSRAHIDTFTQEHGFAQFIQTSAKYNIGCEELKEAVVKGIRWAEIPWRSSPLLFKQLKEQIIQLKDQGRVLMRSNELRQALQLRLGGEARFTDDELKAVVSLLSGPGIVWELEFGHWVLLQPERINAYAQAVIQTLRQDPQERGCIPEDRVLDGKLTYLSSMERLPADEERFVLLAMHQTLLERGLCLREPTDQGTLLIFPSYYRRERPAQPGHPAVMVSYRFSGFLDDIYATLVVRLHHSNMFVQRALWRYAADFETLAGHALGLELTRLAEGKGELALYFDREISDGEKLIFSKYVHAHLLQKATEVERLRHFACRECGAAMRDREIAMERLQKWIDGRAAGSQRPSWLRALLGGPPVPTVICVRCEKPIPLWDQLEQSLAGAEVQQKVRDLQQQSRLVLDNECKERALVGEVISTVALAGQISRELTVSDHGIDMEIEFKDDNGAATAQKLYLQLKSGDSYRRARKSDGAEFFSIKERHAKYWASQRFPVMLVIRDSTGEVRWMEVRDWLRRERAEATKPVRQIIFQGERFDVMSVHHWRDRLLGGTADGHTC